MEEEKHAHDTLPSRSRGKGTSKEAGEEIHFNQEGKLTKKMRENPWILSTFVLGVLGLILLVGNFGGITGGTISEGVAGESVNSVLSKAFNLNGNLISVNKNDEFYDVIYNVEGTEANFKVTLDGEFIRAPNGMWLKTSEFKDIESSVQQEPVDWSVFESELPENIKSKILSFDVEESEEYDASMRINEFANYDSIPKTLISFYGAGCGWCTKYHPVLVEAMEKYPEITIYALDLSANRDIAEKYGATGTPANVINGKYFVSGYRPIEDLSEILDELN